MTTHKYLRIFFAAALLCPLASMAQNKNIGIGTSNPDPSAILDISSTDKGILIPRLTSVQISGITSPPEGLMVYNMDSACYFYYNNFSWVSLCHPGTASNGAHIAIVNGRTDVQLGGPLLQDTDIPLSGKKLTFSTTASKGNVGIGNNNPHPSAILDLTNSNNTGILIPKVALTDSNIAAPVTSPAMGLMVFNTNTQNNVTPGYYFWEGTKWMRIFSSNLPVVSTVSVTAPIVNTGTAKDPNIGITTSDLKGSTVVTVANGTNVLTGATGADIDVSGTAGGVLYGTGASSDFNAAGTTGQYLQSQGAGAPVWATGSDINGSTVVTVNNGAGQGVGTGNTTIDVSGTAGALLYGTGASSAFTAQGTSGQVLQSTGAGAPVWVNPNNALVASDLIGSPVISVTNGAGKVVGAGNANLDVVGTNGGVMYGTGASSAFTPAGTAGQVLRSTGAGAPVWASPNASLSTNDVTGGSVMNITNGTGQVVGGVNMNIDVAGSNGGVMYGTGASSSFTGPGTSGQVLRSNGAAAPSWANASSLLTTTNIVGAGPVSITNGTAQTIGTGNPTINVSGTAGAVLYGTGASSTFTAQGTSGQLLQSTGAGTPTWVNANSALTTKNLTNAGNGVITVNSGANQLVGATNATVDVAGTSGGVLYGTGASSNFTGAGTTNQVLISNGAGAPSWKTMGGVHETIYRGTIETVTAPNYGTGEQSVIGFTNVATGIYFSNGSWGGYTAPVTQSNIRMPRCVVTAMYVTTLLNTSSGTCTFQTYNVTTATPTSFAPSVPALTAGNYVMTGNAVFNDGDIMAIRNIPSIAAGALYIYRIEIDYYLLP